MAISDIRTLKVSNKLQGLLLISCIYSGTIVNIIYLIIILTCLYGCNLFNPDSIGGADIKILASLSIVIGKNIFILIVISSIIAIIYIYIFKVKGKIYFVPFIFSSFILLTIFKLGG